MANKRIVVGNMKMNLTAPEITKYIRELDKKNYNKQVIVIPSSLYLPFFVGKSYGVGIQNIAAYEVGAYTGEVAASQAKSLRLDCTIIGHSERREYFKETDEIVHQKIKLSLASNLKVILCIGETEEERESLKTYKVLKKQIVSALKGIEEKDLKKIIIAYEPIWAIGTGKTPSNDEIKDTIAFIKEIVKTTVHTNMSVLYGGSVNEKNISSLNQIENIDGYLVGGASTKVDKFIKIIEVVVNQ